MRMKSALLTTGLVAALAVVVPAEASAAPAAGSHPCGEYQEIDGAWWLSCSPANDRVQWVDHTGQTHSTCAEYLQPKRLGYDVGDAHRVGGCP